MRVFTCAGTDSVNKAGIVAGLELCSRLAALANAAINLLQSYAPVNEIPDPLHLGEMWGIWHYKLSITANTPTPRAQIPDKNQSNTDFCQTFVPTPHPTFKYTSD